MTLKTSRTWFRVILGGLVAILSGALTGHAQTEFSGLPEAGVPVFDLDVAAFRVAPDSARLEVYYRITNPRLSYVRRANEYVASYEITAILTGEKDLQAAAVSNRENYTLGSFDETRRASGYLINILTLGVREGTYKLSVTLDDRLSGGTHTITQPVDLRGLASEDWVIGGPEYFLPGVGSPADKRFFKDTVGIVPNVTRSFIDSNERLAVYFEVYRPQALAITQVEVQISQPREQRQFTDTIPIAPDRAVAPVIYVSKLPEFPTGQTRLVLQALAAEGKRIGNPVESFFVLDWSLYSMVESDWTRTVDMLVHIATRGELDSLRATTAEKRLEAFEAFWRSKDPNPETEENEWRDEYYRRIRFANRQYSNPLIPGWRTDFGMVYIKYGEPDEVERFPFELDEKPHEIWYYYAQRREFTFIDVRGNGEYELQYPYDGIVR